MRSALRSSALPGIPVDQYDASGTFAYYYAHLDSYAAGLEEGQELKRGDLIGYVGATGNADPLAPHLHFAIFLLGPEKQWWKGTAINPYPLLQRRVRPRVRPGYSESPELLQNHL